MDYLHRFQPLKYWKRLTILGFVAGAVLWAFFELSPGRKHVYAPGPISQGHKLFEKRCSECHTQAFEKVPNDACLKCHNDLGHHTDTAVSAPSGQAAPRCAECHTEHRGQPLVATVTSANCATCHADLRRKDGQEPRYAKSIETLAAGHPEFRFRDAAHPDARWVDAALKLNHKVHLKPDLEREDGSRVTLQCRDCHAVDPKTDPQGRFRNAAFNYETQCRSCHALGFDPQFPSIAAPHEKPEIVREFLQNFYREHLAENPDIYRASLREDARTRPGPKARKEIFASGDDWAKTKAAAAEKDLFNRSCLECHSWKYQEGELSEVAPVVLPKTALKLGRFDHAAHRGMDCLQCHAAALTSEKTSDSLIPGVQNCLQCHTDAGPGRSSCYECHRYHGEGSFKKFY